MKDRPKLPTHKVIRDHWRSWCWDRHNDPPEDKYCFACGMIDETRTLERAHIVARCNGGSDTAENLHLLCHTCHRASEYREGPEYFKWLETWTMHDRLLLEAAKLGYPIWSLVQNAFQEERALAYAKRDEDE